MDLEAMIRMTIGLFGQCHVIGSESEIYAAGMKNLKNIANQLKKERENDQNHNERGENV